MLSVLEDYLERLQALHADIERAIGGLPPPALDWVPGPDMNSLGILAVHVAGAERYWIGDVVGRDPSGRDRAVEFRTRGLDAATLKVRLAETLAHSQTVLEGLTLPDLEATQVSSRDGREFTVAWCLAHALEHTALHLGQMQITRQLWEQQGSGVSP
ncbi:MAG: DinB family protein [Anaerolineae bacterium]|nr:DinB family protein [Anaerolineae bacterium]